MAGFLGKGGLMLKNYRIGNWFYRHQIPVLPIVFYYINRIIFSIDLPCSTKIGGGTIFLHNGLGCVVNPSSVIGENCKIMQNVTIGGNGGKGAPTIGNNVFIGAGACVLGAKVNDGVKIGANAVVLNDIPAFCTAVGVPARVIKPKED